MITLTFTSESAADLTQEVLNLASLINGGAVLEQPKKSEAVKEVTKDPAPTTEKSKPAKDTKAKAAKVTEAAPTVQQSDSVPTSDSSSAPNSEANNSGLTKDDISAAVQSVSSAKDLEVARGIINQFKKEDGTPCGRISDIQVKDYEDFVNTCKATIEG